MFEASLVSSLCLDSNSKGTRSILQKVCSESTMVGYSWARFSRVLEYLNSQPRYEYLDFDPTQFW